MLRDDLARHLDQLLDASRVKDYCPNGLQVEGRAEVASLVTGVTASAALIEAAAAAGADALLVHHGYFWRGEDPRLVGARKRRIELLLAAGINLFAYHLPLDLHPELGNNAQLAARLGLAPEGRTGDQDLVAYGTFTAGPFTAGTDAARDLATFAAHVGAQLGREPLVIGDPARPVRRVAWCTGRGAGLLRDGGRAWRRRLRDRRDLGAARAPRARVRRGFRRGRPSRHRAVRRSGAWGRTSRRPSDSGTASSTCRARSSGRAGRFRSSAQGLTSKNFLFEGGFRYNPPRSRRRRTTVALLFRLNSLSFPRSELPS